MNTAIINALVKGLGKKSVILTAILIVSGFFIFNSALAVAGVAISPATGGENVSIDTTFPGGTGNYTVLDSFSITEFAPGQISQGTHTVSLPSGWEFNTASTITIFKTDAIVLASYSITPDQTSFSFTINSISTSNATLFFNGLQVRPTTQNPSTSNGDITHSGAVITGVTDGFTSFGTLTTIAGTVTKLAFTTQPGGAVYGLGLNPQPEVKTQDQFGNNSTNGLSASLNVELVLSAGSGALQGTASLDIGTGAGNGIAAFSGLTVDAVGTKQLTASADGLIPAVSDDFEISQKTLTANVIVNNKPYDGDNSAAITAVEFDGVVAGDEVMADFSAAAATFADENVDTDKAISAMGIIITGADADNYTFDGTATGLANIVPLEITVTAVPDTKVYDGTTDSAGVPNITSGDLITGDTATWTQSFNAPGVDATVLIPAGVIDDGNGGANYNITFVNTAGVIAPFSITVTAENKNKIYGAGDPGLTITLNLELPEFGDVPTGDLTRDAGENVGDYAITEGTLTLGDNYDVTFIPGIFTIIPLDITVTANIQDKIYGDADPVLTYAFLPALIGADSFTGALTRDAGENVGDYAITQGDLALSSNYILIYNSGADLTINPKDITVTAELGQTKVYGEDDPIFTYIYDPLVGVDSFSGFLSRIPEENVGGYAITQGTLTAGNNYTINFISADFNITARPIIVTAVTDTKPYDATIDSTEIPTIDGDLQFGDTVGFTQSYDTKNVDSGKTLTPAGIVNDGNEGNNYNYSFVTDTTGEITPAPLTATVTVSNKVVDGDDSATITGRTLIGVILGDIVIPNEDGVAIFEDETIGNDKIVTATDITITGVDANNYSYDGTATGTGNILPVPTVVYVDSSWTGTTPWTDPDGVNPATAFDYDAFATIQEGINAVDIGGTINVAAGTYDENVVIDKGLTLLTTVGAIIAPAAGPGIQIEASPELTPVTVDGFTITPQGNALDSAQGIIIGSIVSPVATHNITISNNTITTLGQNMGILVRGVGTNGAGYPNSSGLIVTNNSITLNGDSTAFYASWVTPAHSNWSITDNTFDSPIGVNLQLHDVDGVTVDHNIFEQAGSGGSTSVFFVAELSDLTLPAIFSNNDVRGSGANLVSFRTDMNTADVLNTMDDVTVTGNTFNNWVVAEDRQGLGIYPRVTTVAVNQNSFIFTEGGTALRNTSDVQVDATENWWGTAVADTITSKISGLVDYDPYYVNAVGGILSNIEPTVVSIDDDFTEESVLLEGYYFGYNAFSAIQEGIDAVSVDGTVNVADGNYTEQITITKSLDLIGAGEMTTIILAPAVRTNSVTQGTTIHDYILAAYAPSDTIDVRIEGFTIDADSQNKTEGTARVDGVFFRDVKDASGTVAGLFASTVHNFAATPEYESWGVAVYGDSLLSLDDNDVSDYTRDGLLVIGGNITINGNTITGSATALNGINIQDVSSGSVTDNTVTGNTRSEPWAGGGIVVWTSTGIAIESNHINNNFYGIDLIDGTNGVTVSSNELIGNIKRGISLSDADNNTVSGNTITGPIDGTDDAAIGLANTSTGNTIGGNTLEDGNIITMATAGTGNLYAIYMQFDVATGSNTIQYNTITGGQRAVQFDGAPGITGLTTIANNTISGQSFGGILAYNNGDLVITDNTLTNTVRPLEFFGPSNLTIAGNTIDGSEFSGINLGSFSGTASVSSNIVHNIAADNNGIFAQTSGTGLTISDNTIYDVTGTGGGGGRGIQIDASAIDADIDGNEIYYVTGFAGIVIDTGATGVKINNNYIHDNVQGIAANEQTEEFGNNRILSNRWGVDLNKDGATFVLLNNNISGNSTNPDDSYGVALYSGTANVAKNWWGEITGPTTNDNIGGTGDKIVGTMDFAPWCTNETCDPVDEIAPIANFASGLPDSLTNQISASIIIDGTDVLYYKYDLDGSDYSSAEAVSAPINLNGLDAGSHTLSVIGRDQSGNWQTEISATPYDWTVDITNPTLTTVSIASNNADPAWAKVGDEITLTFTADEDIQTPTATIAGNPAIVSGESISWTATYTMSDDDITEGLIVFAIDFSDLAGNGGTTVTVATDASSVTFDRTAPVVDITVPDDGGKVNGNAAISFITDENSPECSIDGENWIECVSATTILDNFTEFEGLGQIEFTLYLRDTDAAGNIGTDIIPLTKDTLSPTVLSHVPTINAVNVEPDNDIVITFSEAVIVGTDDVTFSPAITGEFEITGTNIITINPANSLESNTSYTITLSGVTDIAGNVMDDYSNITFTTATHYDIPLYSNVGGWNLISLPVVPNDKTTSVILGAASQNIDAVWSFDPTNPNADESGWLMYSPNDPEGTRNLDQMTTGYGYWVSVTANTNISGWGSLLTAGPTVPPSRDLNSGWNLIGYYQIPGEDNSIPANAFSSLGGNYTGLWGFDNNGGVFKSLVDTILPGDAFWISLPAAKTYSPSNIR